MKRGLVFPSLLLLVSLTPPACREDETLATPVPAESENSPGVSRASAGTGGTTTATGGLSPGGTAVPTSPGSGGGGGGNGTPAPNEGGTSAAGELVTVIHSAGATLYVRRGNEEVWIFDLNGNPGATVGDSFEYRSSGGTFGASGGVLASTSGSGATYRVTAARRFR